MLLLSAETDPQNALKSPLFAAFSIKSHPRILLTRLKCLARYSKQTIAWLLATCPDDEVRGSGHLCDEGL